MMNVRRVISAYEKKGDSFLSEYLIKNLTVEDLKGILKTNEDDPDLYDVYPLGDEEISAFKTHIPELKDLNIDQVELFYECYSD